MDATPRLREFTVIRFREHGNMCVAGLGHPQQALHGDLTGRVVQQIGPAYDMRDSLRRIIDDDGEHIGNYLIAPLENDVAHGRGYVLAVAALDAIPESDVARFDSQARRARHCGERVTVAASAGVAQLVLQLRAAAGTGERQTALAQA